MKRQLQNFVCTRSTAATAFNFVFSFCSSWKIYRIENCGLRDWDLLFVKKQNNKDDSFFSEAKHKEQEVNELKKDIENLTMQILDKDEVKLFSPSYT